jgi:hypothetical protein
MPRLGIDSSLEQEMAASVRQIFVSVTRSHPLRDQGALDVHEVPVVV